LGSTNTTTELNANFKILYGDKLKYLLTKNLRAIKDFRFKQSARLGRAFHQPVVLKHEHGFTYAAAGSGSVTFVTAVAGYIENAVIDGVQIFLRSLIDYESAAKGASSKAAFVDSVGYLIENMWQSSQKRIEIAAWYGQSATGLGAVSAFGSSQITFTDATWAPGIWAGMEGAVIEWTEAAKTNFIGKATIAKVLLDSKKIELSGISGTNPAATNLVFFNTEYSNAGQSTGTAVVVNGGLGVHQILSSPTTLHGITSANYSLWQATSFPVGGNLTLEAIEDTVAKLVAKGAEGDLNLYISPATWAKLMTDFAGLRRLVKDDGSRYTMGAEELQIFAQGTKVNIIASPYIQEGVAYLLNPDDFMRIGATDLTYKVPGRGEDLFRLSDGVGSFELQTYSNQSMFCQAPGRCAILTGIVNS
jgi:hypothetical protein